MNNTIKKGLLFLFISFLSLSVYAIELDGVSYTIDTLENFQAGPGTQYTAVRFLKTSGLVNKRLDVFFLKINAKNPYISFHTVVGRDSILLGECPSAMAVRKSTADAVYFAGTNGDFYATTGYVGLPTGGMEVEKQLIYTPSKGKGKHSIMAFDTANQLYLGQMTTTVKVTTADTVLDVTHVNHVRNENELVLYNQYNGKCTRTNEYGTEVLLNLLEGETWGVNKTVRAKVISVSKNKGCSAIPTGQAVLSGHGTAQAALNALQPNQELSITLTMKMDTTFADYVCALGGQTRALMLKNGEIGTEDVWAELHPRTAIGSSFTGDTIIQCVVDGRGQSAGCTTNVLAEIMRSAGAYNAMNLDGGGSSCLYVKEFGQMNTPSDGTERAVSNAIFAVSSAPKDETITEIRAYKNVYSMPRYGLATPKFLGYNQYGTLIDTDVQGVVLSCSASVGEILPDGRFLASGLEGGLLTATYKGSISTQLTVKLITDAEINIRMDSVLVDSRSAYSIEVQSVIEKNVIDVLPTALTWEVKNTEICSVEQGVLTGKMNGSTVVYGSFGTFKDSMLVSVEIPEKSPLVWDNFATAADKWVLTSTKGFEPEFAYPNCIDCPTEIRFTYKTARGPFLKMEQKAALYGLPDTIRFAFHTNVKMQKVIIGLRPNDLLESGTIGTSFSTIPQNEDVVLSVPVDQLVANPTDVAIYPIWIQYITLNLDANNPAGDYFVKLNGISLCYKGLEITYLQPNRLNGFKVYPNPISNHHELLISGYTAESGSAQLLNLQGQLLKSVILSGETAKMDVSDMAAGTYLLQIGNETVKIIKQ